MSRDDRTRQKAVDAILGPFDGRDKYGRLSYTWYRCSRCGAEGTDPTDILHHPGCHAELHTVERGP